MRVDGHLSPQWVSAVYVGAEGWRFHRDSDLTDFVPDPQPALVQDDTATPEPEPDLCECGHGRREHVYGRCLHYIPIDLTGCPCTAYRPASTPQPEPTGLVERVSEAITLNPLGAPRAAILATADWLDECVHDDYRRAAKRVRREGEGSGT